MSGTDARETAAGTSSTFTGNPAGNPATMGPQEQQPGGAGFMEPLRQPPTSAEIDAVIAAAIANAPPAPPPMDAGLEASTRSLTPLMTNILPSAIGSDGRVNLFVGNLPYRVRWQDLKDLFRKAGTVLRADVSLGPDNRSRGYGNVLMGSREDAARAIDRFNGFTWQTRTLEVRPDRLPPEYEPQPHIHHKPMFGYMGPPHHFGGGGGWHGRPPHHGPPFGAFPHHIGPGAHGPAHGSHQSFGRPPLGGHVPAGPPLGASPLAGSLTAGGPSVPPSGALHATAAPAGPTWGLGGRDTLGPFGGSSTSESTRSGSPATLAAPSQATVEGKRVPSPSTGLDQSPLAGGATSSMMSKPSVSPKVEPGSALRTPPVGNSDSSPVIVPPIPLNGLANQAKDLGAPNTLYDRVVFVKNLSLTTQWQDLKDLFRPAGVVIRADVATAPDGQSRGFGTVLFASKEDAQRAVGMFNNHEVDGQVLHVQTERQTLEDRQMQPVHPNEPFPAFGSKSPSAAWPQSGSGSLPTTSSSSESFAPSISLTSPQAPSPVNTRLPWQLDTILPSSGVSQRELADGSHSKTRHPGPISLPPFPSLGEINPLSPLQTRNLPPMTPSMPGFVFNAYPQTPPVHPQLLSPGAGPFSPGQPVTSPVNSGRNPLLNAAPGAPVYRASQGSAALGTPTTQAFPNNTSRPAAGPPGGEVAEDYFPPVADSSKINELVGDTAALSVEDPPVEPSRSNAGPPGSSVPGITVTASPVNSKGGGEDRGDEKARS